METIYLDLSLSLSPSLSISIYLYLPLSTSIYLYLSLSISISLYISVSIYLCLSLSIYRSISDGLSINMNSIVKGSYPTYRIFAGAKKISVLGQCGLLQQSEKDSKAREARQMDRPKALCSACQTQKDAQTDFDCQNLSVLRQVLPWNFHTAFSVWGFAPWICFESDWSQY